MQDPNFDHKSSIPRIALVVAGALASFGCAIAAVFMTADGGGMPSFIEDGLDLVVMALPQDFDIFDAVGWFLLLEGAVWLLGTGVYLAVKLPGIEVGPEAEALRQRLRANISAAENAAAQAELDNLKAKVVKRGLTFAFGGLVSWFFAWILLGGVFNF